MNNRSLIIIIVFALSVGSVFAEQFHVVTFPEGHLSQTSFYKSKGVHLGRKLACELTNMFKNTKDKIQIEDHEVEAYSDEVLNLPNGDVLRPIPYVEKGIDLFGAKVVLYGANDEVMKISAIGSTDSRLTRDWLRNIAVTSVAAYKTMHKELYGDGAKNYKWVRHIAAQLSVHLYDSENWCYSRMSEAKRLEAVKTLILEGDVLYRAENQNTYVCFTKRVSEIEATTTFGGFQDGKEMGLEAAKILKEIVENKSKVGDASQKQENKGTIEDLDLIGTRNVTGK